MISFIVPAHNEEYLLPACLESIRTATASLAVANDHEIIVVNDASTDRTGTIAKQHGATVVDVSLRQIAAVRNAGAAVATGDVFIFLDADTVLPRNVLRAALTALDDGHVAGGAWATMEDGMPFAVRFCTAVFLEVYFGLGLAAGCFIFTRRDAFEIVGGFDEAYFAGEEVHLSLALKQLGPFTILPEKVLTSGRKARSYSGRYLLTQSLKLMLKGPRGTMSRDGLEIWYDGKRES